MGLSAHLIQHLYISVEGIRIFRNLMGPRKKLRWDRKELLFSFIYLLIIIPFLSPNPALFWLVKSVV